MPLEFRSSLYESLRSDTDIMGLPSSGSLGTHLQQLLPAQKPKASGSLVLTTDRDDTAQEPSTHKFLPHSCLLVGGRLVEPSKLPPKANRAAGVTGLTKWRFTIVWAIDRHKSISTGRF